MDTKQLRQILKDQNHSEIAKRTGVHRNLIARFVAGHDIKLSTADKLKAGLDQPELFRAMASSSAGPENTQAPAAQAAVQTAQKVSA